MLDDVTARQYVRAMKKSAPFSPRALVGVKDG